MNVVILTEPELLKKGISVFVNAIVFLSVGQYLYHTVFLGIFSCDLCFKLMNMSQA